MDTRQQRSVELRRLLSPEHTLTDHDRQEVIRIIDSGADVNTPEADGEDRGWSPLHLVVNRRDVTDAHVQIVERLLAADADTNKIVERGYVVQLAGHAPLHLLMRASAISPHDVHERMLNLLLTAGAEVNMPAQGGKHAGHAPLHLLMRVSAISPHDVHKRMLNLLLKAGAEVNMPVQGGEYYAGWAPLHLLVLVSDSSPHDMHVRMLDLLLKAGAEVNMPAQGGEWAGNAPLHLLMLASDRSPHDVHERMLDLLLTAGAEANMPAQGGKFYDGLAPLHLLVLVSDSSPHDVHERMLDLLLKAGAEANMPAQGGELAGRTPLSLALESNKMLVVSKLLQRGADSSGIDKGDFAKHIFEGQACNSVLQQIRKSPPAADYTSEESTNFVASPIKAIMLGDTFAGKTSIVETLKTGKPSPVSEDNRTIGVEVKSIKIGVQGLTVFDFGGHDSYHSTHQLFCTSRTLYLLVVDLSTFSLANCHSKLLRWYTTVTNRAVKAVFIIIGSKTDLCDDTREKCKDIIDHLNMLEVTTVDTLKDELQRVNDPIVKQGLTEMNAKQRAERIQLLLDNRPELPDEVICLSITDEDKMRKLVSVISQTIRIHSKDLPRKQIPKIWAEIMQSIPEMSEPYITVEHFHETCKGLSETEVSEFLEHLVSVGEVLHYREPLPSLDLEMPTSQAGGRHPQILKLSNIVFTKPSWIMEILGDICHHRLHKDHPDHPLFSKRMPQQKRREVEKLLRNGIISVKTLELILEHRLEHEQFPFILELLEKYEMCYQIRKSDYNNDMIKSEIYYCFPILFREERPEQTGIWSEACPADQKEFMAVVQYNTEKAPHGFFEKVGVKINDLLVIRVNWKSGLVAKLNQASGSIEVKLDNFNRSESLLATLRVPKDSADEAGVLLSSVLSTVKFTTLHYPGVVFSTHLPCPVCVKEVRENPNQDIHTWPAENFLMPDSRDVILSCQNTNHDVRSRDVFPIRVESCDDVITRAIPRDYRFFARMVVSDTEAVDTFMDRLDEKMSQYEKTVSQVMEYCNKDLERQYRDKPARYQKMVTALLQLKRRSGAEKLVAKLQESDITISLDACDTEVWFPDSVDDDVQAILRKLCIIVSRLIGKDCVVLRKLFGDFQEGMRVYNKLGRKISLSEEERAYQLLREWQETVGSKANPDDLIKALHSVSRRDIIDDILTKFQHVQYVKRREDAWRENRT